MLRVLRSMLMVRAERLVAALSTTVNLLGRILVNDRERSISVGRECEVRGWIESVGIDAFSDRRGCNYLPSVRINDSHHLVVAAGKQTAILPVHS